MQSAALEMLNLPPLRSNPFDTRPLNREQRELLVGRTDLFTAIANSVRLSSPRIVAVVGERGSGKTSLVQVVASTTDQIHTVFWPSKDHVTTILHQMYCDLMRDFETPAVHSVMIDRLEEELSGRTGLLPMVVFDHPHLSGPDLAEVLTQLLPVLTRMRALTLITLTPGQKSGFPEELLSELDVTPSLEPLNRKEISELISKRVQKASRSSWTPPSLLLDWVMDESGGHVGRAMRYLRDIVDHTRGMPLIDGRSLNLKIGVNPKPSTPISDETFQRVAGASPSIAEVTVEVSEELDSDISSEGDFSTGITLFHEGEEEPLVAETEQIIANRSEYSEVSQNIPQSSDSGVSQNISQSSDSEVSQNIPQSSDSRV
ncbi:MAG: ATP-binding protein, partial [Euryarchaeota archaeon]|nr:ATP-binding protein [Euryarchaeota archaeon]